MTHHKDILLSSMDSVTHKTPQATALSADDALSTWSGVTLTERISSSSLCTITCLISSVPACSFVNLCLTLLGHVLFLIGSKTDAHIHTIPIASSIAVGAIGGAIWGGACLATIVMLYISCGTESYDSLCCLGTVCVIASFITAPAIGAVVMSGTFHGNILEPGTAVGASAVAIIAVCFFAVCLFLGGAFIYSLCGGLPSNIVRRDSKGSVEGLEVQPPGLDCKVT
ncbi:hypothetical protein PILCRDRAFT_706480 [Piloderma croceum F 1598]|uniref:Transmembrane protein n=1 Tax=Piloderma croceum (strain F 1598) TaxID=765440 RepID=A0A0C3BAF7_PILCF|nr:hypothetical protein PILCRDRAFT_706480 [Piloderma croceum F 1598]